MYLGEITRSILISLIDAAPNALLFGGKSTPVLNKHYGFDTSVMSEVEKAWEGNDNEAGEVLTVAALSTFDATMVTPRMRAKLQRVRAAVIKHMEFEDAEVSLKDAAVQ